MKSLLSFLFSLIISLSSSAQEPLNMADFELVNNTNWKGQLTYLDYQSGKQSSINTTMQIHLKGEKLVSEVQYTYEPNKNKTSSVKLKKNGTYFGNEKLISNRLENGVRKFVTSYNGKDNGKKAVLFITYEFSENTYKVTKEVQYENSEERFVRNTYQYTKL